MPVACNKTLARLAALAWLFLAGLSWAAPPQLLSLAPANPASNSAGPGDVISRGRPAQFNASQMFALSPGAEVELTLPDGTRVPYVLDLKQDHGAGIRTWIGRHRDKGNADRAIVTTGPGGSFGVFETPQGEFRLVPGRAGSDVLIDMKAEAANIPPIELGADHHIPVPGGKSAHATPAGTPPQPFTPIAGVNTVAQPKAAPTPVYDLDLLIIYTKGLQQHLRGNLMTRLYFIVSRLNTAYADSEAAIRLRLVHTIPVDYTDANSNDNALYEVSPQCTTACPVHYNTAVFGDVENQRTTYGADLALLARDGAEFGGSGISWIGYTTNRPSMYSVVTGCVLGCEWVFMHELGHQMGLMHDRPTTEWQSGGTPTPQLGKFSYSFGYAYCATATYTCDPTKPASNGGCIGEPECSTPDPSNFSDVMAYFSASGANRNYRFSNPDTTCFGSNGVGHACGVPVGDPNEANGALSINNYRADLAATTSTTVPDPMPGSVQFANPYFAAFPGAASAVLQVTRLGGSGGAVQVSYRTVDGTAIGGTDYTATTGTVSWADGDTSSKTITVPVTGSASTSKLFNVELFGASGAGPMDVAYPSTATVVIAAPWPAGNTVPEGLHQVGTWSVAQDIAFEGNSSVRSPVTLNGAWVLNFEGNFSAGPMAFAYRVSDFGGAGAFFSFTVDNQEVLRDGGESGWQLFVYPLTAGHHFLTWRIFSEYSTPCSQLSGSPGGANCADRLWLDTLVLPPFTPTLASATSITASPNPSSGGQNVSISATVSGSAGTPTGSVDFRDAGSSIAGCSSISVTGGIATCVTSGLSGGTHPIVARYSGDAYYLGSDSTTWQQTVNGSSSKVDPTVTLDASANPIIHGQSTTLTARVAGSNAAPTGSVSFTDGSVTLCGAVVVAGGSAACTASGLAVGTHSIVANYSGDDAYNAAASAALDEVVQAGSVAGAKKFDLDGDGNADLVLQHADGTVELRLMQGTTVAGSATFMPGAAGHVIETTGDFNGDGKSDLLYARDDGAVEMWLMDGTALTNIATVMPSGTGWHLSHVGDFNGDGKSDLLWRNANGMVGLWLMDGNTIFSRGTLLPAGSPWQPERVGDFNGDGKTDIVWRNGDGSVSMWLMNGTTALDRGPLLGAGNAYSPIHVGDFNNDGKTDLVFQSTDGSVQLWLMDGRTASSMATIMGPNGNWTVTQVADFNGDGNSDLVWTGRDGTVGMWLMNGTNVIEHKTEMAGGTGYSVSVAHDMSGDGKSDLVWSNTNGAVGGWLMGGTSIASRAPLEPAGSTNKVVPVEFQR